MSVQYYYVRTILLCPYNIIMSVQYYYVRTILLYLSVTFWGNDGELFNNKNVRFPQI